MLLRSLDLLHAHICMQKILVGVNISCLETKNTDGLTPLHIAARCGTVKYVAVMINQVHSLYYDACCTGWSLTSSTMHRAQHIPKITREIVCCIQLLKWVTWHQSSRWYKCIILDSSLAPGWFFVYITVCYQKEGYRKTQQQKVNMWGFPEYT